jgi:hypothetical protein
VDSNSSSSSSSAVAWQGENLGEASHISPHLRRHHSGIACLGLSSFSRAALVACSCHSIAGEI